MTPPNSLGTHAQQHHHPRDAGARRVWTPLVIIATVHVLLVFNTAALKISIEGIVNALGTSSSTVKTALVVHSLVVAACIMAAARLTSVVGAHRVFRVALATFAGAMAATALSRDAFTLVGAQVVAGAAVAALTPASVRLIMDHHEEEQQVQALSWLSAIRSLSLAPAFLIAGAIATWSEWRLTYMLLLLSAGVVYALTTRLRRTSTLAPTTPVTRLEATGFAAVGMATMLIGFGSDKLAYWGVVRAQPDAPFSLLNLSPALIAIACGVALLKLVLVWIRRRRAGGTLSVLQMLGMAGQRSTLFSIFAIGAVSSGVTFLVPLYVEIVQGRSSLHTAIALTPFTVASFIGALLVGRLGERFTVSTLTRCGFLLVGCGLGVLGIVVRNDWSDLSVIFSLSIVGLGEGALATLLLKALAASAPSEAHEGMEPLCDATGHLAAAVGAALVGALVVGILNISANRQLSSNPDKLDELRAHLDLDRISFVSNDRLQQALELTSLTPEQIANVVSINTDSRLLALKLSFFALAGLTVAGFLPLKIDQKR